MSDAPLVYCRPDECSYCIALARNLETALAELAALKEREPSEVESECARYRHLYEAESRIRKAQDKELAALAELAALKGRRCDECDSREGQSHYCLLLSINTGDAFYCDFWTARAEEGGES